MEPTHTTEDTNENTDAVDLAAVEVPDIEEELLVEEISIDGMCGVY